MLAHQIPDCTYSSKDLQKSPVSLVDPCVKEPLF